MHTCSTVTSTAFGFRTLVPIANTVVSAPNFHVEGRGLNPWVYAFCILAASPLQLTLSTLDTVAHTGGYGGGGGSTAGPYTGIQWCM